MQDELKVKLEAYQKEEASMTDVIKKRRQQELQEMESRTQNSYQMMQEEIQKEQEKLMAPIRTKVTSLSTRFVKPTAALISSSRVCSSLWVAALST